MIAIASDHGGYDLKEEVMNHLEKMGLDYQDFGCFDKESCDYPDFGKPAAQAVANGECEKGILICTTGIGMSIVANKVRGVRAALCSDMLTAELTRLHNDSNVLVLAGGIVGPLLALRIVDIFLTTEFSDEARHINRIGKME